MTLTISAGPVEGAVDAPPSKSHTHRAMVLAALSGSGRVEAPLRSADTQATHDGLKRLGFSAQDEGDAVRFTGSFHEQDAEIDAANSGTTLRILTAVASLRHAVTTLTGDASLRKRPMAPLVRTLGQLGVVGTTQDGRCPVKVRGPIHGGYASLEARDSSQFVTGLMLACPLAGHDTHLDLASAPLSTPYLEITRRMLDAHGVAVRLDAHGFECEGNQRPKPVSYRVPGDWSSAAFFLAAAAVTRGKVTVRNLDRDDPQGDRRIVEILKAFGCRTRTTASGVTVEGGDLSGQRVDVSTTPDLFPVLCAVAAVAKGTTELSGAPHLRLKESDRIAAMRQNLAAFGIQCQERADGLVIHGGKPKGARIDSHADHRIAQAGLLLGLAADGSSTLDDPQVLQVSYPGLLEALGRVGGRVAA